MTLVEETKAVEKAKRYYSWAEFDQAVNILSYAVGPLKPEYIVALARGGLPFATALSHRLGLPAKSVFAMHANAEFKAGERNALNLDQVLLDWQGVPAHVIRSKHCLLVDDIFDTGATCWAVLKRALPNAHPVCLVSKQGLPTSHGRQVLYAHLHDPKEWIVFPWEGKRGDDGYH